MTLINYNIFTWKNENIVLTSSSKPISIIRSASSIQRYLVNKINTNQTQHYVSLIVLTNRQVSKFIIFLSNISINRPGVATIMWTPLNNVY